MSSTALRIVAIVLVLGALMLGYLGYQASQPPPRSSAEPAETVPPAPQRIAVLVAARDIAAGERLEQDDVTTMFVDEAVAYGLRHAHDALGRMARMEIAAGDMVLDAHFLDHSALARNIGAGERAIAIRVDEVVGAGGFLQPGDHVDVLLYLASGKETGPHSSAQLLLSGIRVLAFGNTLDLLDRSRIRQQARAHLAADHKPTLPRTDGEASAKQDKPTGKQSKTAVLAVAPQQAPTLLLAETSGRLRLALHGAEAPAQDSDTGTQRSEPVTLHGLAPAMPSAPEAEPPPSRPPVPTAMPVRQPPPKKATITIHRGSNESAVTID